MAMVQLVPCVPVPRSQHEGCVGFTWPLRLTPSGLNVTWVSTPLLGTFLGHTVSLLWGSAVTVFGVAVVQGYRI